MPVQSPSDSLNEPTDAQDLGYRMDRTEVELVHHDRRLGDVETAVDGRPDRGQLGIRGELNLVNDRLARVEGTTSSTNLMVRIMLGLFTATGGAIWVQFFQKGDWPF